MLVVDDALLLAVLAGTAADDIQGAALDLLDVMLGDGADPEQAVIGGSEQGREEGDGVEDHVPGDEPTDPEL